jgi:hypothetical protein
MPYELGRMEDNTENIEQNFGDTAVLGSIILNGSYRNWG